MPDSVSTSSLVKVSAHAPGGIALETVQSTDVYSVPTLVSLFGTNNVQSVTRQVNQTINNVITQTHVPALTVTLTRSSSIIEGETRTKTIPTITRLAEDLYTRGTIPALFTASRPPSEQTDITSSMRIAVEPEREISADPDIRALYTETASFDANVNNVLREVDLEAYKQHVAEKEVKIEEFFTHSMSDIYLSDYGYLSASDAVEDNLNTLNKYTQYYIFDDVIYKDRHHTSVFTNPSHTYYRVSGSNSSWGITARGKTYHIYNDGEKSKRTIKLQFNKAVMSDKADDVCVDGDAAPNIVTVYWYDHTLYQSERITKEYVGGDGINYIKNVTWDEAMLINTDGTIASSSAC